MARFALKNTKKSALALIGVAALSLTMAAPAFAEDDEVNTGVGTGTMTMSVTSAGMSASYTAGTATGSLTLTVDDPRELPAGWATSDGWYVTMQVNEDFVGTGDNTMTLDETTLKATALDVTVTAGQDGAGTPVDANDNTTLGGTSPVTVLDAVAGTGNGAYSVDIDTSITVPALTRPDTYSATLVTTLVESSPA